MTGSVLWYVLAGFLLGSILSTLWEWLYFRQSRMRIESQRIAELEATVRSLTVASHTTETSTPSGFATGYQSPGVFLEGEQDDVDTVEVIVPASPEPLHFDQPAEVQPVPAPPVSESQYAAQPAPSLPTPVSTVNGSERESQSSAVPVAAAAIAAASVLSADRDQTPASTVTQAEHPVEQPEEGGTNQVPPPQNQLDESQVPSPDMHPNMDAAAEQDAPLALSAILPLAPKPEPVNKNGTMARQAEPPAAALAEAGLESKIEQVSYELDDLIKSLNGLIENTQLLFEQPVTERTGGSPTSGAAQ